VLPGFPKGQCGGACREFVHEIVHRMAGKLLITRWKQKIFNGKFWLYMTLVVVDNKMQYFRLTRFLLLSKFTPQ